MPLAAPKGPKAATYQDLVDLPEHVVGEIIDGGLVVSPRPAPPHTWATSVAGGDLSSPFHRKSADSHGPGGWWIIDEPELHLGRHVLVPDLAGWRRERMPTWPATAWFELPPDWVCEVVSPRSAGHDRIAKARIYRECGVRWYWLVDPIGRFVEVLENSGDRWSIAGTWSGDDADARNPPFDAVAIDLARWWEGSESSQET